MTRYVAFLRAVNLGRRRVSMATCKAALEELGYDDVGSWVNSGNLLFTTTPRTTTPRTTTPRTTTPRSTATDGAADHEARIRARLEDEYGFEITTFIRTAEQVRRLATDKPFGPIAAGHTHLVLLPLTRLTATEKKSVEAMSNDHDECVVIGGDVHWLIRSKSTDTTLGPKQWRDALPDNPTTARNTTMLAKLVAKL